MIPLMKNIIGIHENKTMIGEKEGSPEKAIMRISSPETRKTLTRSDGTAIVGIVFLVLSLAGAVVNLPCFLKLQSQSVYLKVMWRYIALLVCVSPKLIMDFMEDAPKFIETVYSNIFPAFFLSLIHGLYVYIVYFVVTETFVAHTLLLCSIPTTFSATWKIARSQPFTRLEYLGIAFNVFGAYLCCCEAPIISSTLLNNYLNREQHAHWKFLCNCKLSCCCHIHQL